MKKIIGLFAFQILLVFNALAEPEIREEVFVHLNSQTFVSGETMHFSVYCNSQLTGKPSELSKIAYIEIVGENGPVHQQKVSLKEGRGNSQFFISSAIPNGKYHLLAYTRWMKNFDDYFQSPVLIINPFESYPNEPPSAEPVMEFSPLQDPLVIGLENVIAFKLKSENPSNYKGRVVNSGGEVVTSFDIGSFGIGMLKFSPKKGQSYQAILEDKEGKIYFFDFPAAVEKGSFIVYQESNGQYAFKCQVAGETPHSLNLTISRADTLYQEKVSPNEVHSVPGGLLPEGILQIQYTDGNGKLIAERPIFVSDKKLEEKDLGRTYGPRQKVRLEIELDTGTYSISARKRTDWDLEDHQHAIWSEALTRVLQAPVPAGGYLTASNSSSEVLLLASKVHPPEPNSRQVNLLPEIREEIMTGSILDSAGNPAAGQKVALTLPGEPFQLRIGESDQNGNFFIPFRSVGSDTEAYLTVLDFTNNFSINEDNPFLDQYPDFNYELPWLEREFVEEIVEKSIRVQIENAYFDFLQKKVGSDNWVAEIPFHETYLLSEYKRFPTLKETFTEFVITASVRENRDYVIKTTYFPGLSQQEYPPLILLDGVPVSGKRLIELDPYRVESIRVLPNRYLLGPIILDGIVGMKSFTGEYGNFQLEVGGNHKKITMMGVAKGVVSGYPNLSAIKDRNEADQRDQLYWNPAFSPEQENAEISFYTSDVPGEYEIVIEGFNHKGKPVTVVYNFLVK